jgi:hypothetical protein
LLTLSPEHKFYSEEKDIHDNRNGARFSYSLIYSLAGGPGLAVFETWGLQPTHFYSALVITARGNDDFYPAVMLWGLERVARRT